MREKSVGRVHHGSTLSGGGPVMYHAGEEEFARTPEPL